MISENIRIVAIKNLLDEEIYYRDNRILPGEEKVFDEPPEDEGGPAGDLLKKCESIICKKYFGTDF